MIDNPDLFTPWSLHFDRDGTEDYGIICDVDGDELVRSRCFWLPERQDPVPSTLASLRLMHAAPALRNALRGLLTAMGDLPVTVLDCSALEALKQARTVLRSLTPEMATTSRERSAASRHPAFPCVTATCDPPVHVGYRFRLDLPTEATPRAPWESGCVVPSGATGTVVALGNGVQAELDPPLPAAGCPTVQWATLDEFLVDTVPLCDEQTTEAATSANPPADPDGRNDDRASWAAQALQAFVAATGTDREEMLCDLLGDLMHWADRQGFGFAQELERATTHYAAETGIAPA